MSAKGGERQAGWQWGASCGCTMQGASQLFSILSNPIPLHPPTHRKRIVLVQLILQLLLLLLAALGRHTGGGPGGLAAAAAPAPAAFGLERLGVLLD